MDPTSEPARRKPDLEARLGALAAFAEPVRRALYRFVVDRGTPTSRDQAAHGVGVPRHVAKFHLDRLEAEGLLESEYRRPPGRGGPGAGRPAKLYRRSSREIQVSLPERRYELAGRVLAAAVHQAETSGSPIADTVDEAAERAGRAIGARAATVAGRRSSGATRRQAILHLLAEQGYEPIEHGNEVTLQNCPFDRLAADFTDLMCGINVSFVRGVLTGAGAGRMEAVLNPAAGRCCVTLRRTSTTGGDGA